MTTEPKRRGPVATFGPILIAALSLLVWLGPGTPANPDPAEANHSVAMAVDVNTSGNTALALGTVQACRVISAGTTIDVDIIVTGISDIASWEAYIKYDTGKLIITAPGDNGQNNNSRFLLQQAQPTPPSNNLYNTSEHLPDQSNPGLYRVGAADNNVIPGFQDPYPGTNPPQHGDGVLLRLGVQALPGASGFSTLQITPYQTTAGAVGAFIKDSAAVLVGDGADADAFVDNVTNGGIAIGTGVCNDTDGDTIPDIV